MQILLNNTFDIQCVMSSFSFHILVCQCLLEEGANVVLFSYNYLKMHISTL